MESIGSGKKLITGTTVTPRWCNMLVQGFQQAVEQSVVRLKISSKAYGFPVSYSRSAFSVRRCAARQAFSVVLHFLLQFAGRLESSAPIPGGISAAVHVPNHFLISFVLFQNRMGHITGQCWRDPAVEELFLVDPLAHEGVELFAP
ncbi:MAG: hypothetical protein ACLS8R_10050 [Anaeromassilibacillus sp.]